MASVAKTKWKFFNTISYKVDYENTYNINFKLNNFDCTQLTFIKVNTGNVRMIYKFNGGTVIAYDSMREPVWADEAYKTITIYDGQDVETAVLEVFLNANAEKLDFPNYAIYDRNNVVKLAEAFRNKLGTTELLNHTKMINLVNNLALQKQEVEKTYTLDFSSGNIVDTPTSGQVFSKVTIVKPSTLIPSNILAPITIAGVQGSIETYATPEILGKVYKFNTSPTIPTTAQTYIYNFKSNGEHYTYLGMGNNIITYANSGGEEIVYNNGWTNDEYRTVCFEEIPQGELLTMLNNNALRQNSELYFTANGETILATQEKYLDGNLKVIVDVKQLDTSDANATANDIRYTKSAYVNGVKIEGQMQDYANEVVNLFKVVANLTNVTATIDEYIEENGSQIIAVAPNDGFALPDSVTVSGASYTWNKDNGELVLSNATSDVSIEVVGVKSSMAHTLTFDSIFAIKVNNIEVTSPYILKNGDVINITLVKAPPYVSAKITYKENGIEQVKDTDVDGLEFNISNSDIMIEYGSNDSPSLQMGATINYTQTPTLISFTIRGTIYQAEEGMIWGEWVESSYNTDGFIVKANSIYKPSGRATGFVYKSNNVSVTDTIISGEVYTLVSGGGTN